MHLSDLVAAVERAVVRSYDDELAQYTSMRRFGWAAVALASIAALLAIVGVATYARVAAAFAAIMGMAWFVSRAEWEATRVQISVLERALADQKLYIGGRDRDVYLTTDPYDNAWADGIGRCLRSPLPQSTGNTEPTGR